MPGATVCSPSQEQRGANEIAIGEEAHIVGARPGSARYRPLPERERDAYENRILLCPTDHTVIDGQPELWTVTALLTLKQAHEETMTSRHLRHQSGRAAL